jgi:hypothetical protein
LQSIFEFSSGKAGNEVSKLLFVSKFLSSFSISKVQIFTIDSGGSVFFSKLNNLGNCLTDVTVSGTGGTLEN